MGIRTVIDRAIDNFDGEAKLVNMSLDEARAYFDSGDPLKNEFDTALDEARAAVRGGDEVAYVIIRIWR